MASKTWWTVFAIYEDTQEGYVTHVEATDVAAAKARAYREAESVILIAGVVEGKVNSVEEPTPDVTPLRGRGHAITVTHVHATTRKVVVPSRCPNCRSDFRKPRAVVQTDLVGRGWDGHLTKRGDSVSAEKDHMPQMRIATAVEAVRIRCTACKHSIWDGLNVEKS